MRYLLVSILALLGACAPLTAKAPLFTDADADPAFVVKEGEWVGLDGDCIVTPKSAADKACPRFKITRQGAGWRMAEAPGQTDASGDVYDVLLASTGGPDANPAALRVGEVRAPNESEVIYVAVYAPRGRAEGAPYARLRIVPVMCTEVLDLGPINGVSAVRDANGRISSCEATSKDAVREAARRAALVNLDQEQEGVLVFVK
jgi:hypothetical protein